MWRARLTEARRPKVLSGRNFALSLALHLGFFAVCLCYAWIKGFCKPKDEPIVFFDPTVVVNENLDGREDEPPPLAKPPKPEPPKPKPKPPPKVAKKPDPPKALEQVVTNVVAKKDAPEKKREVAKKPEEPKKTAKQLREERIAKMRESAKTVKGSTKVTIEVRNQPSGDGRTAKKTLSDAEIRKLLDQGYRAGATTQLAPNEKSRCLSLIQRALDEKWAQMLPQTGQSGTVHLSVRLNSAGGFASVSLSRSCGDRLSDQAALSVAKAVRHVSGLGPEFLAEFSRSPLTIRYQVR